MKMSQSQTTQPNGTIDILKFIMAVLVIGGHTYLFGFNIWLDRGYGIITRLCIPFFFMTSAYFYWTKEKGAWKFLKRILLLYLVWSIIYLPFDIQRLPTMTFIQIIDKYFWSGNGYGLWYLCATGIGFLLIYLLLKCFKPKIVLIISIVVLIIGCVKSTWSPLFEKLFSVQIIDFLGSCNGLFYAFPYMALGMCIAKAPDKGKDRNLKKYAIGFVLSMIALVIESVIFVLIFHTESTILWISVLPSAYCFFMLANNIEISIPANVSVTLRKMSTLFYVSQFLFIVLFRKLGLNTILLFAAVLASAIVFSLIIISLAKTKPFRWLKILM